MKNRFAKSIVVIFTRVIVVATVMTAPVAAQPAPPADCGGAPTVPLTEGPFYKTGSPLRKTLVEPGLPGKRITVAGYVFGNDCRPVPGARLDFWQADGRGVYDNSGFGMRGHQFTDAAGRYALETVLPADYTGRTAHLHVKVRAGSGPELTTQIFFPGRPRNRLDSIFDQSLVAREPTGGDGTVYWFNFVLR